MSRNLIAAACCVTSCLIACSNDNGSEPDSGQVTLQVAAAPSDVHCLVIQATGGGRTVTRNLDVMPGQIITAPISGLPTGSVTIGASAYAATCSALTASSIPNWMSDPVSQVISLTSGTNVPLNLVLRPSSTVTPTIDWQYDGMGGGSSMGGASSMGGGSSMGGATSFACGLPAAGATGVAKPSGTPGNLTVLNWAGYKGATTYTFDGANSSQIMNFPQLNSLGVHMTFYLVTGKTDATNAVWGQAAMSGHELGNHTQSNLSPGTAADVDAATTFIQQTFGVKVWTMAAPNGDSSFIPLAQTRFLANRGVANAIVLPNDNTDPFNLPSYIPPTGATASVLNAQIDAAQTTGGWRIMTVSGFTGGNDGAFQPIPISEFVASVNHTTSLGNMWVDTMVNVAAYWRAQKMLSAVTPTTMGTGQMYSWTLPANFPPGKCLRVKVAGGTLTQGGKTLAWDTHGYYEISLDAGSLTIAP